MSSTFRQSKAASVALTTVALLVAVSIAFSYFDDRGFVIYLLSIPGGWLSASLLWTSWWVPAYFVLLAWLALDSRRLTWPNVILLNAGTVPVLTLALFLQLARGSDTSPLVAALAASFTTRGSMLVASLLLALEALIILQIPRLTYPRTTGEENDLPALLPPPDARVVEADPTPTFEDEFGDLDDSEEEDEAAQRDPTEGLAQPDEFEDLGADETDEVVRIHFQRTGRVMEEDSDEEAPEPTDPRVDEVPLSSRAVRDYEIPVSGILNDHGNARYWEIDEITEHSAEQLKGILDQFGIEADVTGIRKGPVITMFEILPAPGIKLARITNLADNIAMGLAASSVRIVAPIPGKRAVGIEIPNKRRNTVSLGEMMDAVRYEDEHQNIPVALGKDIPGEAQVVDLTKTPHLLIAGATGSGKSVCVNSIICSILYQRNPVDVKFILIDPKIVELKHYNGIPHLLTPVITDPKRAFQALQWLLYEMERRYAVLDSMSVRDVVSYNAQIKQQRIATLPLPFIVVVIDEFADLMATSGKELESTVARLAAMSRAVGIHLILATQRPSTDVITGLIKANIPSRIAFAVAQKVDSRIILDSMGADKLLGQGDMLFTSSWDPFPIRLQGAYVSDDEVERIVAEVKRYGEPEYIDDEMFFEEEEEIPFDTGDNDPLMEQAVEIVLSARKASASYLQRRLKVGYNRAARMVEEMERVGIVGPQNGSKPREVIGSP